MTAEPAQYATTWGIHHKTSQAPLRAPRGPRPPSAATIPPRLALTSGAVCANKRAMYPMACVILSVLSATGGPREPGQAAPRDLDTTPPRRALP